MTTESTHVFLSPHSGSFGWKLEGVQRLAQYELQVRVLSNLIFSFGGSLSRPFSHPLQMDVNYPIFSSYLGKPTKDRKLQYRRDRVTVVFLRFTLHRFLSFIDIKTVRCFLRDITLPERKTKVS